MSRPSFVLITVQDHLGNPIPNALVQLDAEQGEHASGQPFVYDANEGAFRCEGVEQGAYRLTVVAEGFLDRALDITIAASEYFETVQLGRMGQPYYVQGGRRCYFEQDGAKLAALVREADEPEAKVKPQPAQASAAMNRLESLAGTLGTAARPQAGLRIYDQRRLAAAKSGRSLTRDLLAAPEVLDAGPLLAAAEATHCFLSSTIEVQSELEPEALAALVAPFGLNVFYRDGSLPHYYQLRSETVVGPEFGALPEQLMALDGIDYAGSIISAAKEDTFRVAPGDPLFALQFHHFVSRVPEAWSAINPAGTAISFGSADIIVAVDDRGILTTGGGAAITHPEFSGTVVGGTLSGQPGLNNNKTLITFDFSTAPMRAGNDVPGTHGSWVAGTLSAAQDTATGCVGGAANTRLASYIFAPAMIGDSHTFAFYAGLDPRWQSGVNYAAAEPFPWIFGTGRNPIPGCAIVNGSHGFPNAITQTMRLTFQRVTLFGRNHRGCLVIASAGNNDQSARSTGTWAANTNVIRVAASSLDHRMREVRMNYSNFALLADRSVDFAAPSESQNITPTVHQAPAQFGFVSVDNNTTSGDLQTTAAARANLTNSPASGTNAITVAAADLANFAVGNNVIVRNRDNPLFSELHSISTIAAGTITLLRNLGYAYNAGHAEIIRLDGTTGYSTGFGGTSAAAPQASAIAALMLSVNPALSWLEVRELMRRTAVPINLRYRGSLYAAPPHFRYRWLDTTSGPPADLIDAFGLLTITGGNKTVTAGPLPSGERFLTLDNTNGIAARQALVIGAETRLNGAHPKAAPNQNRITVHRNNEFETGDVVFIGKSAQTTVIQNVAAASGFLWVQSVDGFVPGDDITIDPGGTAETVRIVTIRRLPNGAGTSGPADTGFNITRLNAAGNPIAGGLANPHNRTVVVTIAATQREGPFTVMGKPGSDLVLNNPVTTSHPDNRIVWKQNTEVKAVIRVMPGNRVEIDPLEHAHPFNGAGVEHVRVGRIASYSLGFGFGRLDALEAVQAAKNYDFKERDLVIRNFLNDDGETNTATKEVESPDIWARNDAATTLAGLPNYADPGPHEIPRITVDPAIFSGTGRHDLDVSGTCTSVAEVTFTVEIAANGPDTFKWKKDAGNFSLAKAIIAGTAEPLSDGVSVTFANNSGHVVGDTWTVRARQVPNRFLHVRTRNRGTLPFFTPTTSNPAATWSAPGMSALDLARSRLLLCVSDGFPVCRFSSTSSAPGNDDLEVTAAYTGATRALFTVEIEVHAAGGDTYRVFRDGTQLVGLTVLTPGTLNVALNDGVQVTFGSHSGHSGGDRWDIYARPGAEAFMNLDHYWDQDEPNAFAPSGSNAGTRILGENPISGLGAGSAQIDSVIWAENLRLPTNNPSRAKPSRPLRLFALGEVVPHDGKLMGFDTKSNNNISFRELSFTKLSITQIDGVSALSQHLDVDKLGNPLTTQFQVQVRATAGTFATERVRLKLTSDKGGVEQVHTWHFDSGVGAWQFAAAAPAWINLAPPLEARRPDASQPAATGEQYDIRFDGSFAVEKSFTSVKIEVELRSTFRDLVLARSNVLVHVYEQVQLPTGVQMAQTAKLPAPSAHVFCDMATLTQNGADSFGPVSGQEASQFRVTSRFTAPADVKAYAVCDGFVMVQRDPANNDTVNLILRPFKQPIAGFTPVRYFIYRGLNLTDFLVGNSPADEQKVRGQAGASDFIRDVWTTFLIWNVGAVEMPSTVLGYEPGTQTGNDPLDAFFFQVGGNQLHLAKSGMWLGNYRTDGGNAKFGFEVILEEGGYTPSLNDARLPEKVVDVGGLPSGTAAQRFALRLAREEILNFMDPAAFFGLHLHPGGKVAVPAPAPPHTGQDVFSNVVSRFHSRHRLYVDLRGSNGNSLNFYGNYNDGSGNQIQTGPAAIGLTPAPYATHSWPILMVDGAAPVATANDFNTIFMQIQVDDNEKPVLYADHGQFITPTSKGPFVRDALLRTGANAWTETVGLRFANTGPAGARLGVAWVLRLFYGRLANAAPVVPVPDTVLKTATYTDNVFGPIDRNGQWAAGAGLAWFTTQANRYVDAEADLGWKQMMACGMALQTGGSPRALLYGVVRASDTNIAFARVPIRGIADGVSASTSPFADQALFGAYQLEQDQLDDNGTAVRSLRLRQHPTQGYPPTNALLMGLDKAQLDTLKALAGSGLNSDYGRFIHLAGKTTQTDLNGKTFDKYRLGIQGLKTADGLYATDFPAPDIHVYTVDGQFFFSKLFSDAEPLPTSYARNFEEEKGSRLFPAVERRIAAVLPGPNTVIIDGLDWTREIVAGDKVKIDKSNGNDGEYPVTTTSFNGNDTEITLGAPGVGNNTNPLGSVFSKPKPIEDLFIDMDQGGPLSGVAKQRDLHTHFVNTIGAIANTGAALAALRTAVDDVAANILRRARLWAAAEKNRADDAERSLYWQRNALLVALKSHPFCLASLSGRNELVNRFEIKSRGYDLTFAGAPGGAQKILLTGFDPFGLTSNPTQTNPSAAVALALHGQTLSSSGKNAYVASAIFPVRYGDFDAGRVETLVDPHLAGPGKVAMIITVSQGRAWFDLERIAARYRGGYEDNAFERPNPGPIGADATYDEFYETTLPAAVMVPGPFNTPPAATQAVFFNESYTAVNPAASVAHPKFGAANGNAASFPFASVTGQAREGSGGDYLSNEIFYRVARRRVGLPSPAPATLTGHFHIPRPDGANPVAQIIAEVENLIKRWLDSLP